MAHELAINSQPDVNEKTSVSPRLGWTAEATKAATWVTEVRSSEEVSCGSVSHGCQVSRNLLLTGAKRREFSGMVHNNYQLSSHSPIPIHSLLRQTSIFWVILIMVHTHHQWQNWSHHWSSFRPSVQENYNTLDGTWWNNFCPKQMQFRAQHLAGIGQQSWRLHMP